MPLTPVHLICHLFLTSLGSFWWLIFHCSFCSFFLFHWPDQGFHQTSLTDTSYWPIVTCHMCHSREVIAKIAWQICNSRTTRPLTVPPVMCRASVWGSRLGCASQACRQCRRQVMAVPQIPATLIWDGMAWSSWLDGETLVPNVSRFGGFRTLSTRWTFWPGGGGGVRAG